MAFWFYKPLEREYCEDACKKKREAVLDKGVFNISGVFCTEKNV